MFLLFALLPVPDPFRNIVGPRILIVSNHHHHHHHHHHHPPRFLRGLGSVAEPIYPANYILQGCGFACHFARGLLHSLLDHVHQLYPVELTEFVDDITHAQG